MFAHGQTVVRLRRGVTLDPYSGRETLAGWASADELAIANCAVAAVSSTEEPTVDRDRLTTMRNLYGPIGMDVAAEDRIRTADGLVWNVLGDPQRWSHPMTGWQPGAVVRLERIEVRR